MNVESLKLAYGDGTIAFRLERRDRKTLAISVSPDSIVDVVAPVDASLEKILEMVRKRAPWIRRQQRFFVQFQPRTPDRLYVAGETHLYLQSLRPKQRELTKALVEELLRERAHIKFRERLALCQQRFPRPEEFEPSGLVIRQLQQRWGSMTSSGKLILNRSLIRASVDAIDYVITHELCHLRHNHHGARFFELLDRVMPDWEKRKLKLECQLA